MQEHLLTLWPNTYKNVIIFNITDITVYSNYESKTNFRTQLITT